MGSCAAVFLRPPGTAPITEAGNSIRGTVRNPPIGLLLAGPEVDPILCTRCSEEAKKTLPLGLDPDP